MLQRALFSLNAVRPLRVSRLLSAAAAGRANPTAVCDTTMGTFKVECFVDQMPITASNFIDLAQQGYYDGIHFHRVVCC